MAGGLSLCLDQVERMGDEVIGLCLLVPMDMDGDGEYFLYLTECRADGARFRTWISCYEEGTTKPERGYPV